MTTMQPVRVMGRSKPFRFAFDSAALRQSAGGARQDCPCPHPVERLTERENNVLERLCFGFSNREIAGQLRVSEDTVKYHLKNIYGKIGVHSRTHAVLVAQRTGLISAGESARI